MSSLESEQKKNVRVAVPSRSRAPCTQPPGSPGPADAGTWVCDGHATVSPKHSYKRRGGWPSKARATRGVAEPASLPAKSASPLPVCRGACPVVLAHHREGM